MYVVDYLLRDSSRSMLLFCIFQDTGGEGDHGRIDSAFGGGRSGQALPYYATTQTIARPSTPHEGDVRLVT